MISTIIFMPAIGNVQREKSVFLYLTLPYFRTFIFNLLPTQISLFSSKLELIPSLSSSLWKLVFILFSAYPLRLDRRGLNTINHILFLTLYFLLPFLVTVASAKPNNILNLDATTLMTVTMGNAGDGNFDWTCEKSIFHQGLTIKGRGIVNVVMILSNLDVRGPLRFEVGGATGLKIIVRNSKGNSNAASITFTAEPVLLPATLTQRLMLSNVLFSMEGCWQFHNVSLVAGVSTRLTLQVSNTTFLPVGSPNSGGVFVSGKFESYSRIAVYNVTARRVHIQDQTTLATGTTIDINRFYGSGIFLEGGTSTSSTDLCTKAASCSIAVRNSQAQGDGIAFGKWATFGSSTYIVVHGGYSYGVEGPGVAMDGTWRSNVHLSFLNHTLEAGLGKGAAMTFGMTDFSKFNGTIEFWNCEIPIGPITFTFPATANPRFFYIGTYTYHPISVSYTQGSGAYGCARGTGGLTMSMPLVSCLSTTRITRCTEDFSVYDLRWPAQISVTDLVVPACNTDGGRGKVPTLSRALLSVSSSASITNNRTKSLQTTQSVAPTRRSSSHSNSLLFSASRNPTVTLNAIKSHSSRLSSSISLTISKRSKTFLNTVSHGGDSTTISKRITQTLSKGPVASSTINTKRTYSLTYTALVTHTTVLADTSTTNQISVTGHASTTRTHFESPSISLELSKSLTNLATLSSTHSSSPQQTYSATVTDSPSLLITKSRQGSVSPTLYKKTESLDVSHSNSSSTSQTIIGNHTLSPIESLSSAISATSSLPIPILPAKVLEQAVPEALTASITSVAVAVGGASAAVDAQAMAVIGLVACSSGPTNSGGYRSLSPVAVTDSCRGVLVGNSIALGAVGILSVGVVLLFKIAKIASTYRDALSRAKAPSLFCSVSLLLLNSFAVCGNELLQKKDDRQPIDLVLGAFSLVVVISIISSFPLMAYLYGSRRLLAVRYDWGSRLSPMAYRLLPTLQFDTRHPAPSAFSSILGPNRLLGPWWTLTSFFSFLAVIPVIIARDGTCTGLFGLSAAIYVAFAVFVAVKLPRRTLAVNMLQSFALIVNGCVMAVSAVLLYAPSSKVGLLLPTAITGLGYTLTFCTVANISLTVGAIAVQLLARMGRVQGVCSYECGSAEYYAFFWSKRNMSLSTQKISHSSAAFSVEEDVLESIKSDGQQHMNVFEYHSRLWPLRLEEKEDHAENEVALLAFLDLATGTSMIPTVMAPSVVEDNLRLSDVEMSFQRKSLHYCEDNSSELLDEETQVFLDGLDAADEADDLASYSQNSSFYTLAERDGPVPKSIYDNAIHFRAQIALEQYDRQLRKEFSERFSK